ncbi:MAG TPA: flagellar hook-length control protein [Thermoanaerobaculia bacterium]|nr:flagellar hook-length control protein [Thermoanaerobaculia bacterium]
MRKISAAALFLLFLLPCVVRAQTNGMTWKFIKANTTTGTISVGCVNCNAYQGDTPCTTALPILCIKKSGAGFPLPKPASVDNSDRYYLWSGGVVGTTKPTVPPAKRSDANALCVQEFGPDWRVAEHHDSGFGWHLQAYGGVGNPAASFWVDINDQPGTCWH